MLLSRDPPPCVAPETACSPRKGRSPILCVLAATVTTQGTLPSFSRPASGIETQKKSFPARRPSCGLARFHPAGGNRWKQGSPMTINQITKYGAGAASHRARPTRQGPKGGALPTCRRADGQRPRRTCAYLRADEWAPGPLRISSWSASGTLAQSGAGATRCPRGMSCHLEGRSRRHRGQCCCAGTRRPLGDSGWALSPGRRLSVACQEAEEEEGQAAGC